MKISNNYIQFTTLQEEEMTFVHETVRQNNTYYNSRVVAKMTQIHLV